MPWLAERRIVYDDVIRGKEHAQVGMCGTSPQTPVRVGFPAPVQLRPNVGRECAK